MKPFLNLFTAIIILSSVAGLHAQNRQVKFAEGKWAEILERSKKENKLIYLDCYTTWCGPCKWMAKNVFTNDSIADFYNAQFVNVEIDMEKGEGLELAKKYGIRAYPTMLYLNSNGEIIHRTCGSVPVLGFLNNGKDALDPDKQLATMTKKFSNGNAEGSFAYRYFGMLDNGCQSYSSEVSAYLSAQKESDLTSRTNWDIIYKYVNDYFSKEFTFLEKNKESFSKMYTADSVRSKIISVYNAGLYTAIYDKKHDADYQPIRTKIKESGSPDAEKILFDGDLKYYQNRHDWNQYASIAAAGADKYMSGNPNQLNGLAWNFYENVDDKAMLEKASGWAKHACELAPNYPTTDTYAAVLYKLGKKEEAKTIAEKAIALAKESGDDSSETQELLKKIEKLK